MSIMAAMLIDAVVHVGYFIVVQGNIPYSFPA
jgi:hypothetical protein